MSFSMLSKTLGLIAVVILLMTAGITAQSSLVKLYVSDVQGLYAPDTIAVVPGLETEVTFIVSGDVSENISGKITGSGGQFTIKGTQGVTLVGDFTSAFSSTTDFDGGHFYYEFPADTVHFAAWVIFGGGMPPGWSGQMFTLTATVGQDAIGNQLCLDSLTICDHTPCIWDWTDVSGSISPDWDGPYCYDVISIESCCQGTVGNVNMDPDDVVDISDLTEFVNRLFLDPSPVLCAGEANTNADPECSIDVADLQTLVQFLFLDGPPMPQCQAVCAY